VPPRSRLKRQAILDAAIDVFLREGYARTSVDAIAAAAGVGKQTVYGHFGDKQRLFLAAVDEARAGGADGRPLVTDTGDPRADLTSAGERMVTTALAPRVAALHRLTIAELAHHPELQRSWKESAGTVLHEEIATYLRRCDRDGLLAVPDPALAARQFAYVLITEARVATHYGTRPLDPAERRSIAESAADLIVRAYRP
jgi:TetR/AcrR family transcriptional regulator, mexJK operon transcriptional repressor